MLAGCVDSTYIDPDRDGRQAIRVQEYTGPRLSFQDILSTSSQRNVSLMSIGQPSPLCPFRGWFPMYTDWPVPQHIHQAYEQRPWPPKTDATIVPRRIWRDDADDVAVQRENEHPAASAPEVDDTLDGIWQDIQRTRTDS